MFLEKITWVQAKEYFAKKDTVIIPVGSTENHGSQLCLGTDFLIPRKLCEMIDERLDVMIAPTIPYGVADQHDNFPGTISIGAKYIKTDAQKLMYGATEKSRDVTYTPTGSSSSTSVSAVSLVYGANDTPKYVGFVCYAPDLVDKVKKFTCFFVACCLFGPPAYSLQTKGQSITFATPTTTGEFQPDDSTGAVIQEIYVASDENEAKAWCAAVLPTS